MKHLQTKITKYSIASLGRAKEQLKNQGYLKKYDTDDDTEAVQIAIYDLNKVSLQYWQSILRLTFDGEKLQNPAISSFRVLMELNIDIGIIYRSLSESSIKGAGKRFLKSIISEYNELHSKYKDKVPETFKHEYFTVLEQMVSHTEANNKHWSNIENGNNFAKRVDWFYKDQKDEKGADIFYLHYKFFSKLGTHITPLMIGAQDAFDENMIPEFAAVLQLENIRYLLKTFSFDTNSFDHIYLALNIQHITNKTHKEKK